MSDPAKRISRQELHERIWAAPLNRVTEQLETSYIELARICDELNVPKPAHGHWQRIKLGLPVEVVPLPPPIIGMAEEGMLKPKGAPRRKTVVAIEPGIEKPSESPPEIRTNSDGEGGLCESQAVPKKCVESGVPVVEPKISTTVEYTREQLHQAIWSSPCIKLAATLGVSDVALAKTCRRLGVPRPPRGYWARIEAGEKLPKERLPAAKESQDRTVRFDVTENVARREEWAANNVLTAGKSKKPSVIELPSEGIELHPIAEKHRRALEKAKLVELGFVTAKGTDLFCCNVSLTIVPRLVRAMHAIICELEDRDYSFEPGTNEYEGLQIAKDKDRVSLQWSEAKIELEREPTNADKRRPSWTWQLKEMKPSGQLTVEVSAPGLRGKRKWCEAEGRSMEELLGVAVEKVEATFRGFEDQRKHEAEWARQREEEAKRDAERRAKEAEEWAKQEQERKQWERMKRHEAKLEEIAEGRRRNLTIATQQWIKVQEVGRFIKFCEDHWRATGGGDLSKVQADWLEWARAEAVKIGQFPNEYPDPTLDGRLDVSIIPLGGPYPETKHLK